VSRTAALLRWPTTLLRWAAGVAVFAFMALCLLFIPLIARPRAWDGLAKFLCRLLVACFGLKVRVRGLEKLEGIGTCIIICNHVNILDTFLLYGHIPLFFRGLDQAQHFSWPVWGWFSRRVGNISLDQGGGGRTAGGLRAAGKALAEGTSLLVFPEGHRTRDGEFLEFHRGAFRLAERHGVTILPIVQAGTWEVLRTGTKKGPASVKAGPVELTVLEPWTAAARSGQDAAAVRDRLRDLMAGTYAESRARLAEDRRN